MRKRMYFLLPDVRQARAVFNELLLTRIEEKYIHVMAKEGTPLGNLPEATLLQKSDALHGASLGLLVGGATGALAGAVVMLFPPSGMAAGLGVVLALAILGAIIGIWAAGMLIGTSTPSTHLEAFSDEIARGRVLMIVDVPNRRADEIARAIRKHHPQADMRDAADPGHPLPFP